MKMRINAFYGTQTHTHGYLFFCSSFLGIACWMSQIVCIMCRWHSCFFFWIRQRMREHRLRESIKTIYNHIKRIIFNLLNFTLDFHLVPFYPCSIFALSVLAGTGYKYFAAEEEKNRHRIAPKHMFGVGAVVGLHWQESRCFCLATSNREINITLFTWLNCVCVVLTRAEWAVRWCVCVYIYFICFIFVCHFCMWWIYI